MKHLLRYILGGTIRNIVDLEVLKKFNSDVFNLWRKLGYTEGLSDENAIICSNAADAMARYILNINNFTNIDDFHNLIEGFSFNSNGTLFEGEEYNDRYSIPAYHLFALIRRLYSRYNVVVTPMDFINEYKTLYPSIYNKFLSKERETGITIDVVAEATALLCEIIAKKTKKY